MAATVISYSMTGNNDALATSIAAALSAQHHRIKESKSRRYFTISLDLIFGRTPKIDLSLRDLKQDGLLLLVAPVWMGKVAFPLRRCLRELRGHPSPYAFIALSGGGEGPDSNPHLGAELEKRTGRKPLIVINLHIADLVPVESKPTPQEIENYNLTGEDMERLTQDVVSMLEEKAAEYL